MERYLPVRTRSRPPGLWSNQSLRPTIGLAPISAVVGDRRLLTRSSLQMAVGTIPHPRRRPDDAVCVVFLLSRHIFSNANAAHSQRLQVGWYSACPLNVNGSAPVLAQL